MKIPAWIPARYEDWIATFPPELGEATRANHDRLAAAAFVAWVYRNDSHGVITVEQVFAALGWPEDPCDVAIRSALNLCDRYAGTRAGRVLTKPPSGCRADQDRHPDGSPKYEGVNMHCTIIGGPDSAGQYGWRCTRGAGADGFELQSEAIAAAEVHSPCAADSPLPSDDEEA